MADDDPLAPLVASLPASLGWTALGALSALLAPLAPCLLPFAMTGLLVSMAKLGRGRRHSLWACLWIDTVIVAGGLAAVATSAMARALAGATVPAALPVASMVGFFLGPVLLAAGGAYLAFTPLVLLDPKQRGGALFTSAHLAHVGGGRPLVLRMMAMAALSVAPAALALELGIGALLLYVPILPIVCSALAASYRRRASMAGTPETQIGVPGAVRGLALGVALLTLLNLAAFSLLALHPSSMHTRSYPMPMPEGTESGIVSSARLPVTIPGTSLRLSAGPSGVVVDGDDRAEGFVLAPFDESIDNVRVDRRVADGVTRYEVFVYSPGHYARFTLDETGALVTGLDVSPGLSNGTTLLLVIALSFGALAGLLVGRPILAARFLREVREDSDHSTDGLRAFEGVLQIGEGDLRLVSAKKLEVDATAAVVRGSMRLDVPPGVVSFLGEPGPTKAAPRHGDTVTVVGRFERLTGGFRDAALPWPSDAVLIEGDRDRATGALMRRVSRRGVPLLFPVVVALAANLFWLAVHL